MNKISLEQLMDKLRLFENKYIKIDLEGTIIMEFVVHVKKIIKSKDYIEIETDEKNIKLNAHQIMKIEVISKGEILVKFDGLQTAKIIEEEP